MVDALPVANFDQNVNVGSIRPVMKISNRISTPN